MSNKRILVVDDDDGIREVIQICLEAIAGWEVIPVSSGAEGLKQAEQQQPDAILLDVMMPCMDGITTFKQLQINQKIQHIPTILLTAKAKISEQKQLQNLGVAGVIVKPFEPQNLINQIKNILNW
ncbi:response regulator receiver protein [Stanieria cyanosphaera PCC 7437]|uniref:Response regulator receiver protein n=1 Tax=Stanieria cyanosphaera (strain ATCC 29371 / PCC 7437) TaxID=111780 RepID=K9XRY8_STAC7|nr:response regulator [Stanieria cyanosphaera]AFZ34849.1 response regulator receiver protein [Stanieria cyanosphaera PCC 7437]